MKVNLYGKEYNLEDIYYIRINEKIIGIDKKCWIEVVENGVATKIEGTNTLGKAASVNNLKKLMNELNDKGLFVIDSKKNFLCNIENADKVEFYENLSLLGKKYFLRVKINGKVFDTMHMYNPKIYSEIEKKFREIQDKKIQKKINKVVHGKYDELKER